MSSPPAAVSFLGWIGEATGCLRLVPRSGDCFGGVATPPRAANDRDASYAAGRLIGQVATQGKARLQFEEVAMASIKDVAKQFFEACETGKGWEGCKAYCKPDATFSAQAEPLTGVKNLQQYTDWMKGLLTFIPDGRYELKSFGTDDERKSVCAYGVFSGTHTGQGGPCPPTGKSVKTDYVY